MASPYWTPAQVEYRDFVIVVSDIRRSTEVLSRCHPAVVGTFFQGFARISEEALQQVNFRPGDFRINRFTGDGFLIFIRDVAVSARRTTNPAVERAVRGASRMFGLFQQLCVQIDQEDPVANFSSLHVGIGIHLGRVPYGPVAGVRYTPGHTGVKQHVILACRLADVAQSDEILLSRDARHSLDPKYPALHRTLQHPLQGLAERDVYVVQRPDPVWDLE
jgi:class 3 adenylate cyclase